MRLENKVCAITGGGGGIGRAAAELFAAEGASVVILEWDEKTGREAEAAIAERGGRARFIRLDVSDFDATREAFGAIEAEFARLDALYNNASVFLGADEAPIGDLSLETWRRVLSINLDSVFFCSKFALPLMEKSGGGSIIHTSSSAGIIGIPKCAAYTATKGATVSLTRNMAVDYGPRGVRVNCIAPAAIATPMVKQSNFDDPDFDEQAFLDTTPVRRWGEPEEIARIALFLASDESSYLNGAIIVADGGITIT